MLDNKEFCDELPVQSKKLQADENEISVNPLHSTDKIGKEDTENELDEKQIILNMQAQIKELEETVNKLCKQIEGGYSYPVAKSDISGELSKESDNINEKNSKNRSKKKKFAWIGEMIFYGMLIALILGAFLIRSNSDGRPISIAGYSAFTVLTGSMESEIPQGSLVISKTVDPETLQIGDDITYMSGPTSTITHRIIGITENYLDTNERAFETQGVMNANPDKNPVPAANVVGKVVYHNEVLGQIATFASNNWPFLIFILIVAIALFTILKRILRDDKSDKKDKPVTQPKG